MQFIFKIMGYILLFLVPAHLLTDDVPLVEAGVCSIGNTIGYRNDGNKIGMFDVTLTPLATLDIGSLWALANPHDSKKRLYVGFASQKRQSQIFRGTGEVNCLKCEGSGAQDPNERENPCPNPANVNYCVKCVPTQCNKIFTLTRCQSGGAEGRAQAPATAPANSQTSSGFDSISNTLGYPSPSTSLIGRLGLVAPETKK